MGGEGSNFQGASKEIKFIRCYSNSLRLQVFILAFHPWILLKLYRLSQDSPKWQHQSHWLREQNFLWAMALASRPLGKTTLSLLSEFIIVERCCALYCRREGTINYVQLWTVWAPVMTALVRHALWCKRDMTVMAEAKHFVVGFDPHSTIWKTHPVSLVGNMWWCDAAIKSLVVLEKLNCSLCWF